jgi:uridine kinase
MHRPYTIGISGGSGSGKTHFIRSLSTYFKTGEICQISQDHYYKPIDQQLRDDRGVDNFDIPDSIDVEKLAADIRALKAGNTIVKSAYRFNNAQATPEQLTFQPAPIIIVEGLFVHYFPEIARELDLKIFIEAKDHIKLTRRIKRDNDERGYDLNDVLYRYQYHVMPVYESMIKPLQASADFIIPNNNRIDHAVELLARALRSYVGEGEEGKEGT